MVLEDWNQMVEWAFASYGELTHDVTKMNNGQREVIHTHHNEESQARIQNDNNDRWSLAAMCINPLNDA